MKIFRGVRCPTHGHMGGIQDYTRPRNAHLKIFNTISAYLCNYSCQYCYHIKQKWCVFFSRRSPDPLVPSQFPPFGVSFQWTHPKKFLHTALRLTSNKTFDSDMSINIQMQWNNSVLLHTQWWQKFFFFFNTLNCKAHTTKSYMYLPVIACSYYLW